MIHFAPLNHRGVSDSPYAIYDQLAISPDLFPQHNLTKAPALSPVEKEKMLKDMVFILLF